MKSSDGLYDKLLLSIRKAEKICSQETVKEHIPIAIKILEKALFKTKFESIPGHCTEHSFRVLTIALALSCFEGGNKLTILFASLLHDIARPIEERMDIDHAEYSAKIAEELLKKYGFSDIASEVSTAIREHRYRGKMNPSAIESAILQDADRLDALGAIGIARVFAYGGFKGRLIQDSLKHFHEKILKLPSLMNTKTAKMIAKERLKKLERYLNELSEENELLDFLQLVPTKPNFDKKQK